MRGAIVHWYPIDIQYETVLAVLYASYVPAQIPSNMVSGASHSSPNDASLIGRQILNRISRCGDRYNGGGMPAHALGTGLPITSRSVSCSGDSRVLSLGYVLVHVSGVDRNPQV